MAFSTGVSLLTAGGTALRNKLVAWSQMNSGANYVNEVTGNNLITSVSGLQSSASPIGSLGSHHVRSFGNSAQVLENSFVDSEISALRNKDYTVGFWLKISNTNFAASLNNVLALVASYVGSGSSYDLYLSGIGVKDSKVGIYNSSSGFLTSSSVTPSYSVWHFYTFKYKWTGSGSNYLVDIYFNNSLQFSNVACVGMIENSANKFCSKYFASSSGSSVDIRLDSLFIGKGTITPDDLTYLYNAGSGRNYSDLPLY